MIKEDLAFGGGSFVGEIMQDQTFFDLPMREQARIVGWADGCPVVTELTDPDNQNPGRGPEAMLSRYATINFWFGVIGREVADINPDLNEQLMTPQKRNQDEPVGKYEPESVPESYMNEMYPMNTLAGYGLPRIVVEQIGMSDDISQTTRQDRMVKALDVVDVSAAEATTPLELLALVGEGLIHADTDPEQVLKHVLSVGWVQEHNAITVIDEFKDVLADKAPLLWQYYCKLSVEQKNSLKLA